MALQLDEQFTLLGYLRESDLFSFVDYSLLESLQTRAPVPQKIASTWGDVEDDGNKPSDGASNNYSALVDDVGTQPASNADVTASNNNWSDVVDDDTNKPDNNADVTSANTAANIASQGDLATEDTVDTTLIDNLAVTAGKLANAAVETAKLDNLAVTAGKIATDAVEANKIKALNVTAGKIAANAVTATEINVATLSAISADVGTITAGTITGATIQTSASANTGVKMSTGAINIYGSSTLVFKDTSGNTTGFINSTGDGLSIISASGKDIDIVSQNDLLIQSGTTIKLNSGTGDVEISNSDNLIPSTDNGSDLGSSSNEWKDLFIDGTAQVDALRIDQTPAAATPTPTHTIAINCNGTSYDFPCIPT